MKENHLRRRGDSGVGSAVAVLYTERSQEMKRCTYDDGE